MNHTRRTVSLVLGITLFLLAGTPLPAQTLHFELTGENPGDRSGSTVTRGYAVSHGWTGCGPASFTVACAPGWSTGTGRVEFWQGPILGLPTWHVHDYLDGAATGEEFGFSVDMGVNLDGQTPDYVVGAPGASGEQGYVQGFHAPNNCESPFAIWTVHGIQAGERYGHVVVGLGDVDGDRFEDVLVGAPGRTNTFIGIGTRTRAGMVQLLSGATGAVLRTHKGSYNYGNFGISVAVLPDLDGDGVKDYAIGEPGYDAPAPGGGTWNNAGRVRIFSGRTGASLSARDAWGPKADAKFGMSIAAVGDADHDGTPDILVGAPYCDGGSGPFIIVDQGYASVQSGASGTCIFGMYGPGPGSHFGMAVTGGEDLLGDGYPEILIGAPDFDSGRGRAQVWSTRTQRKVYDVTGNSGEELGAFVSMDEEWWTVGTPGRSSDRGGWRTYAGQVDWRIKGPFTSYGSSLAVLDDVDGDGWDDLAIGQYDTTQNFVAPILDIRSGATSAVLYTFASPALHGHTVAGLGDLNGDGVGEIAHGMPAEGIVEICSGRSPGTVLRTHTEPAGTLFGHAMADAGDVDGDGISDYLIGQPDWDQTRTTPVQTDAGRVCVYSGATGARIRTHEGASAGAMLGFCVAALGDVNGDGRDDYGAGAPEASPPLLPLAGRAFVWSGLDGSAIWSATGDRFGRRFGRAMCGPGDVDGDGLADFAVSDPYWGSTSTTEEGRVRIFKGGPTGSSFNAIQEYVGSVQGSHVTMRLGWALAAIGDVDRDGIGDIAYSCSELASGYRGGVWVRSCARGLVLYHDISTSTSWPSGADYGSILAGRRGLHADRRQELLVGAPSTIESGAAVDVIFLPENGSHDLGGGCGSSGSNQPLLTMSPSKLGQCMHLVLSDMPSTASPAILMGSLPTPTPLQLGFGCALHLDPLTAFQMATLPGNCSFDVLVPEDLNLAGFTLCNQVLAFDNNAPLLIVFSNGLLVTFGF